MIAVGPGAPNKDGKVVPTAVKAGDRVLLPGWGGNAIKVGEEVRVLLPSFMSALGADACFFLKRSISCLRTRRFWRRLRSRAVFVGVREMRGGLWTKKSLSYLMGSCS